MSGTGEPTDRPPAGSPAGRPTPGRLVSPLLVGRSEELRTLVSTVSAAPAVVVVEGEAGVGKTRLVGELRAAPELAGRRLLTGGCRRLREPFPLGPFVEALRGLADELAGRDLSPVAGALAPLLPELAQVLPPAPAPLDDRVAERHRVFRGLVAVLAALGPTVFVVEDAHWADGQTLDFLSYLLGDPPDTLAMVLTFRGDEVDPALRTVTARLPEQVEHAHVFISALDAPTTGALAAAILGTERVSAEFAEYLRERASGLPFAVQELLALARSRGTLVLRNTGWARKALSTLDVPAGVRDPVRERVATLGAAARAVLETAAVLHEPVAPAVLAAACPLPPGEMTDGLREALESGLLTEHDSGIGFRHVLAAQTVYDDLPALRRRELHDRAAGAVRLAEPVPLGQLAHHLRHADRAQEWVAVAEQAADKATSLGDDGQALRLLDDLLRHARLPADHRARLAVKLGWANVALGKPSPDVIALLAEVAAQELPRAVRGELRFVLHGLLGDPDSDPDRWRRQLADTLPDLDHRPDLKTWTMVGLGIPRGGEVSLPERRRWLRRALDNLTDVHDLSFAAFIQAKIAMILVSIGDPGWRELTDRLLEQTGGTPRHRREVKAYESVASEACLAGHHDTAVLLLDQARRNVAGCESRTMEIRVEGHHALLDFCRGAWDDLPDRLARLLAEAGEELAERLDVEIVASCLAVAHGDLDSATPRLEDALRFLENADGLDFLPMPLAAWLRVAVFRGDLEPALARAGRYLAAVQTQGVWPAAARVLPVLTQAFTASGRPDEGQALVDRFALAVTGLDAPLAPAALSHARGFLAAAGGQWPVAARHFHRAAQSYEACVLPYEAAQAQEQAAVALFTASNPQAQATLRGALDTYQRLGARWDRERATSVARRHGMSLPARYRGGQRGYGSALSPRERQVAELAATGRTNREIAAALFLSPNTVDKHLTATLRKLGLRSRTALAHHLLTAPGQEPHQP